MLLVIIMNLISLIAFISKRSKLLQLAANTENTEEKNAFLRSADGQIWKIVLFGIALFIELILLLMITSSPH